MDVSIIPIKGVIPESGIAIHSPFNSAQADSSLHFVLKYWFNGSVIKQVLSGKPILIIPGLLSDCSNGFTS